MQTAYDTSHHSALPNFASTQRLYTKGYERWRLSNPYFKGAPFSVYAHQTGGHIPNAPVSRRLFTPREIQALRRMHPARARQQLLYRQHLTSG